MLAMAMAFMFVLVTVVIAMHASQARATRTVTQSEAELQFSQAAEFAAAGAFSEAQNPPGSLGVSAQSDLVGDLTVPANYGSKLYQSLPNWSPKDQEFAPGHRTYKFLPKTNDEALKVFAGKFQWLVGHDSGGYAIYAPNGSIRLGEGVGWANPTFADERKSDLAFSGVPFLLASKAGIEVGKMPYGNAYSVNGPIDLGDDAKDLALAFRGPLPLRAYEKALKKDLEAARGQMEMAAISGSKIHYIKGRFERVADTLAMFQRGDSAELSITLEQAMKFPFPTIPSFSVTVPDVFFEFWFHVPYPPDFSTGGSVDAGLGSKDANGLTALQAEIKALQDQIESLKTELGGRRRGIVRGITDARLREAIRIKDAELGRKKDEWEAALDQIKDHGASLNNEIWDKTSNPKGVPVTRAEDRGIPKTGMKGWNYSNFQAGAGHMLSLLMGTIEGNLNGVAKSLTADVRLVHFGREDNEPDFRFADGFYAKTTWTVPPGRPFKIDGKMTIAGDLWLQKGSVMHVTGDLTLENPDPSDSSPLKPSGKLVMEEGSTLIVGGDFRCAGDPRFGSLWVCSPPTQIAPVNSAIFVTGSATFPHGSFSSTTLEAAARALEGSGGLADALGAFFNSSAPNLGKIAGAFHERAPYFASFASSFQLTIIPPTLFNPATPIATPIPLPKENLLVPLFRTMTTLYAGALNARLGENTYTQADWWGFGEGVVPVMIKLDPLGPMDALKALNLNSLKSNLDWSGYLNALVSRELQGAAEFAIKTVGQKLITEVMTSVAPGGSIIGEVFNQLVTSIDPRESVLETLRQKVTDAAVSPVVREFERFKGKADDEIKSALKSSYMREVCGPLIYAKSISVGDATDQPLLMAGMLVAEDSLNVNTESFVGSLTSFNGNISAGKVYFHPAFTRVSLYKAKGVSGSDLDRVADSEYGKKRVSGLSVDVATGVRQVTTESWSR